MLTALALTALLVAFYPIAKASRLAARDAAIVAALASAALATNYALAWLPNLKLMDALVFSAAFLFGFRVGAWTGAMIWAIWGSLNPYGFEPLIWLAVMAAESVYAAFGTIMAKGRHRGPWALPLFSLAGLGSTLIYDAATNLACGVVFSLYSGSLSWTNVSLMFLAGIPFAAAHAAGNALAFPALAAPLVGRLQRFLGRGPG